MRRHALPMISALALALGAASGLAQDDEPTMRLMPEHAAGPDAVTGDIELPRDVDGEYIPSDEGVTHSAEGLAIANAARENGRAFGEEMAAKAQEQRENLGRAEPPNLDTLLPDHVPGDAIPELPGRPELPEPAVQP